MKESIKLKPVGHIETDGQVYKIKIKPEYGDALTGLDEFSHINVLWWFNGFEEDYYRDITTTKKPYKKSPDILGIFATRSPVRPNPVALDTVPVLYVNRSQCEIAVPFIDAHNGSPVLDIKPYTPSCDRPENFSAPDWCTHWPKSIEESESFDWEGEFSFTKDSD